MLSHTNLKKKEQDEDEESESDTFCGKSLWSANDAVGSCLSPVAFPSKQITLDET